MKAKPKGDHIFNKTLLEEVTVHGRIVERAAEKMNLTICYGQQLILIVFKSPDKYIDSTKAVLANIKICFMWMEEQYHYYLPSCCECLNEISQMGSINAAFLCTAHFRNLMVNFQNLQWKISKYDWPLLEVNGKACDTDCSPPGNSKLCTLEIQLKSSTQIEAKNKTHLMEIPHDFFLIAPENSNSTLGAMSPYSFCHAKYQSDVLGAWVSKNVFIMMFCVTKWFKRKPHFKRKNISKNKISQCMHASFPFHHNTLVFERVFKFCLFVIRLQLSNYYGFCSPHYNRVT